MQSVITTSTFAFCTIALTSVTRAQVALNEMFVEMAGVDDREFIELYGPPGSSLDGYMVLVLEGSTPCGLLEDAWDLTGLAFEQGDPYFVIGATGSQPDLDVGPANILENGSQAFYLIEVPDAQLRSEIEGLWLGTDVTMGTFENRVTRMATNPGIRIADKVLYGGCEMDQTSFVTSSGGALRSGDCPGFFCANAPLDFETPPIQGDAFPDPTPGAANPVVVCFPTITEGSCSANGVVGVPLCSSTGNNGVNFALPAMAVTGSASIADDDLTLRAYSLAPDTFGFFFTSMTPITPVSIGLDTLGRLCIGGAIGRYVGQGQVQQADASGGFQLSVSVGMIPQPSGFQAAVPGDSWHFQAWARRPSAGQPSTLTSAWTVEFQ